MILLCKNLKKGFFMNATTHAKIQSWLQDPFDEQTKKLVQKLIDSNPSELEDSFYTDLSFGTGGLRGLMGVGTNRMNCYTIRKTTQGLANYLRKRHPNQQISVVIGFDCRLHSEEFAKEASFVLQQNGINVFFLPKLRPTPFISFACRHCQAQAAIMITASHNPKEYNGYKVYGADGAQVVPPDDIGILEEIHRLQDFSIQKAQKQGQLHVMGEELDLAYLKALEPLQKALCIQNKDKSSLRIVYTSLHGTGITLVPRALRNFGFSQISLVDEQSIPDGTFPTVALPNPEYKETLQLGLELLQKTSSDLLLATDPDADRLAIAIPGHLFTGNETAALCVAYLCDTLSHNNTMPKDPAVLTTIVSTDLLEAICEDYRVLCIKFLTGFKYIGEQIHLWEKQPKSPSFLFGAEESYGYLYGTHARDKDAVILSCLIAEMALHYKNQKKTLLDGLHELYQRYGIFKEKTTSLEFPPGKEGSDRMQEIMKSLREHPFKMLGSISVVLVEDFLDTQKTKLPKSNVLSFHLQDKSKIIIRPSGTEPKIKIYGGVHLKTFKNLTDGIQKADQMLDGLLEIALDALREL